MTIKSNNDPWLVPKKKTNKKKTVIKIEIK